MKKTITFLVAFTLAFANLFADTEELLGEYHFNDATTYWQVEPSDAINMGMLVSAVGWTHTINDANNGRFRAVNGQARNYGFPPLSVFVEPKPGFTIWVSKIEIKHKTTAAVTGMNQRFAYSVTPTAQPLATNIIWGPFGIATSAADTTLALTIENPVQVLNNKFWFYNAIHTGGSTELCTTEVDYIKIYGTYSDPFEPAILVPAEVQSIKGAPIGQNSNNIITISHRNLSDVITTASSKPNFSAYFTDADEGIYNELRVEYTATQAGFETADITLSSGTATSVLKVMGWGLPENTIAAWNFETQTINPDYAASITENPTIEDVGPSTGVFFFHESWTYEMNNLYTTVDGVEVPEISGMKIKNLGYTGMINLQFNIRARNASPNSLKVGTYNDELSQWSSGVYWRNPRINVGWENNVSLDVQIYNGEFSIVSAFDQTLEPPRFEIIQTTQTAYVNTNGWPIDNIIITPAEPQSVTESLAKKSERLSYVAQNQLHIRNNQENVKVEIYALDGTLVKLGLISGGSGLQVAGLKGIYMVRINDSKKISHEKVLF